MRARRTDSNQAVILKELRGLGLVCVSLHTQGGGVEDLLIALPGNAARGHSWLLAECKSPRNKRKEATASQFTKSQVEWYERTKGFPRITVMGPEDAVEQLRKLMST